MLERLEKAQQALKALQKELLVYLKDKRIPIGERWEVACKSEDFLPHSSDVISYLDLFVADKIICWYSEFNAERYSTVVLMDDEFIDRFKNQDTLLSNFTVEALKEEILQNEYYSFTNDW